MECEWNSKPQNCDADAPVSDNVFAQSRVLFLVGVFRTKFQEINFIFLSLWILVVENIMCLQLQNVCREEARRINVFFGQIWAKYLSHPRTLPALYYVCTNQLNSVVSIDNLENISVIHKCS